MHEDPVRRRALAAVAGDRPWTDAIKRVPNQSELTDFCWDPRSDGIYFACEELPPKVRIGFEGGVICKRSMILCASQSPTSMERFRMYDSDTLERRHAAGHVRKAGKIGVRRKIFRIDEPVERDVFSPIAQAFVWNEDLKTYFSETLPVNP